MNKIIRITGGAFFVALAAAGGLDTTEDEDLKTPCPIKQCFQDHGPITWADLNEREFDTTPLRLDTTVTVTGTSTAGPITAASLSVGQLLEG